MAVSGPWANEAAPEPELSRSKSGQGLSRRLTESPVYAMPRASMKEDRSLMESKGHIGTECKNPLPC